VHVTHHYAEEPKCARLFRSDFLEAFSKTAWWVVPAVWLPVCAALWAPYARSPQADPAEAAVLLASGVFIWTLVEYSLHRWVFHLDGATPDAPAALTAHFLIHGVHHKIPLDRYRLVMPPVMLAPLAAAVYALFRVLIPVESGIITHEAWHAMYASGLAGYVGYDGAWRGVAWRAVAGGDGGGR
jgi:4-hydroxysphinganine ceramide fatty acyl 2-hydroxylase